MSQTAMLEVTLCATIKYDAGEIIAVDISIVVSK